MHDKASSLTHLLLPLSLHYQILLSATKNSQTLHTKKHTVCSSPTAVDVVPMSIPLVCYCMAAPRPLVQLLNLLHRLRLFLSAAFFVIDHSSGAAHSASVLSHHAPTSSSSAELKSPETPSRIKAQLPVVEYGSMAPAWRLAACDAEEEHACAFCMEAMEARDQVRELGNCRHAFHKGCMDRWVDLGRVSCPVCRSDLVPKDESKCALKSLGHVLVRRHNFGPPRPVTRT